MMSAEPRIVIGPLPSSPCRRHFGGPRYLRPTAHARSTASPRAPAWQTTVVRCLTSEPYPHQCTPLANRFPCLAGTRLSAEDLLTLCRKASIEALLGVDTRVKAGDYALLRESMERELAWLPEEAPRLESIDDASES